MENMEVTDKWYYLIVQNPDTPIAQFLGFSQDDGEKFLPVFKSKQDAKACFSLMPKDLFTGKYDVHAVIEEDVRTAAKEAGHKIFILDEDGKILKQLE